MKIWILLMAFVSDTDEISLKAIETYSSEVGCYKTVEYFKEYGFIMYCEEYTLPGWEI